MSSPAPTSVEQAVPVTERHFSVEEYHALIDNCTLSEDGQYELLRGRVVKKMTKKPSHVISTDETADLIQSSLPAGWCVRKQDPITLSDSEPEPDIVVAQGKRRDYLVGHPRPSQIALVVEVAESSLSIDRSKAEIYAANRIPHYWIVNLVSNTVEVMGQPQGEGETACYASVDAYESGQQVPLSIGNEVVAEVPVEDILP